MKAVSDEERYLIHENHLEKTDTYALKPDKVGRISGDWGGRLVMRQNITTTPGIASTRNSHNKGQTLEQKKLNPAAKNRQKQKIDKSQILTNNEKDKKSLQGPACFLAL